MYITEEKLNEFEECIKELREIMAEDIDINSYKYYAVDMRRVLEEDRFLLRFILFKKGKVNEAANMIKTSLAWRKEFGVNDITKDSIPSVYFATNAVASYKNDNNVILVVKAKDYKKMSGMEDFTKKFVVYWLEMADKHSDNGQVTILFNFKDCGLSNLDMEMIKFLITVFTSYYPLCISHILIYELPWLLNAAWKLIKSWLPDEAVELIKLVDKDTVLEYIDRLHLPIDMGGTNKLAISDVPEKEQVQKPFDSVVENDSLVQINPIDQLGFLFPSKTSMASSSIVVFSISNVSKSCVAFKIKTTSRQRYRAWPFTGLIQPGDRTDINAQLINGATCQENDKFLVMVAKVKSNINQSELDVIWNSSKVMEYRLRCVMTPDDSKKAISEKTVVSKNSENVCAKLEYLENIIIVSQRKQTRILYLCCLILFIHFLLDHSRLILSIIDDLY